MQLHSFSKPGRLCLILSGSLLAVCAGCAPQSYQRDANGVYLLPAPRFSIDTEPVSNSVAGKKYLSESIETAHGSVAEVLHFYLNGKMLSQNVTFPDLLPRNEIDHFGFYTITETNVLTAIYGPDSGLPGLRYYYGSLHLDSDGDLFTESGVVLMPIGEATEPAWEWRLEE